MKPKILYLLIALTCVLNQAFAQQAPPAMFNYQGAARNTIGQPLSNKNISLQISILDQSESGKTLYSEIRHITTSPLGLYNIQIGAPGANGQQGAITDIEWGSGPKYIRVEIDADNGNNFLQAGVSQLLSVPYALYSAQSGGGQESAGSIASEDLDIRGGDGATLNDVRLSIKDGAISNPKLAAESVTAEKIKGNGAGKILGTDGNGKVGWIEPAVNAARGPWYDKETLQPAQSNTQHIYQLGQVGVMTQTPLAALDVRGSARFGMPLSDASVGENSVAFGHSNIASASNAAAFGMNNVASGTHAAAFGMANTASGTYATAFGTTNTASGSRSTIFGTLSEVSGSYSTSFGSSNKVAGWMSTAVGGNLRASGNFQLIAGTNNALTDPDQTAFQIGNGDPNRPTELSNALTLMKYGNLGVGTHTAVPHSTLQVYGSVAMRIRAYSSGTVADEDYTVMVRGNVHLPQATDRNEGRIYNLVNDRGENSTVTASIRINGQTYPSFTLDSAAGSRGITLQSDGQAWILIGQF